MRECALVITGYLLHLKSTQATAARSKVQPDFAVTGFEREICGERYIVWRHAAAIFQLPVSNTLNILIHMEVSEIECHLKQFINAGSLLQRQHRVATISK